MQEDVYLVTEEAAAYLRLKERKLYDLVAQGAIPCAKVTGKWLFPRAALDRWIEAGLMQPDGFSVSAPPAVIGGSHDPLLEWSARQSHSGLALLAEGSEAGLDRLEGNAVSVAAIHLHGQGGGDDANLAGLSARAGLHDAVLIAFARREQGFLVASGNPLGIGSLRDVSRRGARIGLRPAGAGAQLLLQSLAAKADIDISQMVRASTPYPTGADLALGLRDCEIDCGIATRAVANLHGLDFVPLLWERFDLAVRRRTYFEPPMQQLLAFMRDASFRRRADALGGYDIADAGTVRLNR